MARLAHLCGREHRELRPALAENLGGLFHEHGPVGECGPSPALPDLVCLCDSGRDLLESRFVVSVNRLARRRIN